MSTPFSVAETIATATAIGVTAGAIAKRSIDPVDVFCARCWAGAYLWHVGEYDLHEAVDTLQAAAVRSGMVARIRQDNVQAIMHGAFRPFREDADG